MVGKDLTPCSEAVCLPVGASASTLAITTDGSPENVFASASQVGARDLQSAVLSVCACQKKVEITYVHTMER